MPCFNKQPTANLKCIIFTIILTLGYWFLPQKKSIAIISIVIGTIISLFLYDRHYQCSNKKGLSCIKYIICPLVLALLYWYLPPKNKWILLPVMFLPYLVLAWYDYIYSCERNMGPTYLSLFYAWAKPRGSEQIKDYKNWCPDIKKKVHIVDGIIAIALLMFVPFYIKWKPK